MVETYKPNGIPLTDYERELLVILMEECAEVIQAASKLIRFGKENRPDSGIPNTRTLALEFGDLQFVMDQVARPGGMLSPEECNEGYERKRERLAHFMQTSA